MPTDPDIARAPDAAPRVAAVILAAGAATRMGQAKQLLDVGGQPMLRRCAAATTGARLAPVVAVVPAALPAIAAALADLPLTVTANAAPERGMLSSIKLGLAALPPPTSPHDGC